MALRRSRLRLRTALKTLSYVGKVGSVKKLHAMRVTRSFPCEPLHSSGAPPVGDAEICYLLFVIAA